MTPAEFASQLRETARRFRDGFPLCVSGAHARMGERIFERGERAGGGQIGQYEATRGIYIHPDRLPVSTSPRGKPGRERNVASRRTAYFASYRDLRSEQGRESSFVNFRLTGNLQRDFLTGLRPDGEDWIAVLSEQRNVDIKRGLESKYGDDIFALSEQEISELRDCIEERLADEKD